VHVLDTDALSVIQRGGGGDKFERLAAYLDDQDDVRVTVVSFHEQIAGALNVVAHGKLTAGYRLLHDLLEDFCERPILPFDAAAERILIDLKQIRPRRAAMDLRIAAIALLHDATLVTGNVRHFERIPGLDVYRAW
jgi:tRNA(fMet)-specific endonuclease VapC